MLIKIIPGHPTWPLAPIEISVGSALPLVIEAVPRRAIAVSVTLTKINTQKEVVLATRSGSAWKALLSSEFFASAYTATEGIVIRCKVTDTEWEQLGTAKLTVGSGGGTVIPGGGEPAAYIKDASLSNDGKTLTLTKKDGTTVALTDTDTHQSLAAYSTTTEMNTAISTAVGGVTPASIGAAAAAHTHTKAQITDLVVPTTTSALTNDSGFITANDSAITGKLDKKGVIDTDSETIFVTDGVKVNLYTGAYIASQRSTDYPVFTDYSGNKGISLPNEGGVVALTSDIRLVAVYGDWTLSGTYINDGESHPITGTETFEIWSERSEQCPADFGCKVEGEIQGTGDGKTPSGSNATSVDDDVVKVVWSVGLVAERKVVGYTIKGDSAKVVQPKGDYALKSDIVQADWNTTDTAAKSYIKNKPTIPDVSGKADKSELDYAIGDTIANRTIATIAEGTSIVVPDDFKDLLIKTTGAVTSLTLPSSITTAYGDDLPTSGNNIITVTKLSANEALIKVIKLEAKSYV